MPSLGADMDRGWIVEWRVAPGDAVHLGDIVAVVGTEKSDIEVEVFQDGVVEALLVEPGAEVPVGTPLARISGEGPEPAEPSAPSAPPRSARPAPQPAARPAQRPPAPRPSAPRPAQPVAVGRRAASPYARIRAAELGVDLAAVTGTGPSGTINAADVERTAAGAPAPMSEAPPASAPPVESSVERPAEVPPTPADRQALLRRSVADLMARSKREVPHYYLATTIDMGPAMAWLAEHNADRSPVDRVLPAALLLKATALAAREAPAVNGWWHDGFEAADRVDLGVAISLRGGGLVAPAILTADDLAIDDLMAALKDLVARSRAGRLRGSEMAGPSITVTNLGDQGADEVLGVIYPPQVALVGFGRVVERPWAVDGAVVPRPTVRATLAADHRASDGHQGSKLLALIDRKLQSPEDL